MLFEPGQTVVFAGDSITDCGRDRTAAPDDPARLGSGYVHDTVALIDARYPGRGLRTHNAGYGGYTTAGMLDIWSDDVLAREPEWVTLLIGVNDVHRTLDRTPEAVPAEEYERNYRALLDRTKGPRLVLLEPFYMWPADEPGEREQRVLEMLAPYRATVRRLAEEHDAILVPLHDIFAVQLKHRPLRELGNEPVHPSPAGHLVIAHALLAALAW